MLLNVIGIAVKIVIAIVLCNYSCPDTAKQMIFHVYVYTSHNRIEHSDTIHHISDGQQKGYIGIKCVISTFSR